MSKESGINCLFKVANDASPSEFNSIAGQRDTKFAGAGAPIDVADKTTGGWGATITGVRSATVTLQGVANWPDTTGLQLLRDAWEDGVTITGRAVFNSSGNNYQGEWSVTAFEVGGGHNDATTYNVTLQNAGALTYSASEA